MKKKDHIPLNYIEKNNVKISFICSIAVLLILLFLFQQLDYRLIQKPADDAIRQAELEKQKAEEIANTPVITQASVIAVGDNLYHGSLLESGKYDTGEWNYDHIYEHVLPEIQAADVALIDQETVLTTEHDAIASYPSFATPTEVGDAIMKAGFNVVESATNHIDDYGYDFMAQTFDFWKTNYPDVPVLGIHETAEDAEEVKTLTVNDITFAFLDFTYGTNNGGAGEGRDFMIDTFDQQRVSEMIQKAKAISDCLIFVAHWGTEDETMPNEYEKQWAAFLMQQGVDVVIGGHPHVMQPYGFMSDDAGHSMLIFYSLGNFVSTQQELPELLEGMASFTVQKTTLKGETTIQILEPEIKPMVMHYNHDSGDYGPYMLEDYTEELASQHSVRSIIGDEFTLANLKQKYEEIMCMNVEPSTKTNLLNVKFDWEGNMIDKTTGNVIEDTDSVRSYEYWSEHASSYPQTDGASGAAASSGSEDSGDTEYDSYDGSYEYDSSYGDDSSYGYGSYDSYGTSYDDYY